MLFSTGLLFLLCELVPRPAAHYRAIENPRSVIASLAPERLLLGARLCPFHSKFQGCNFWKLIGGAERGKDAQGTIKILLNMDFTSYLAHFLHSIVGAQLNIEGAQVLPKRYKVTPMPSMTVVTLV